MIVGAVLPVWATLGFADTSDRPGAATGNGFEQRFDEDLAALAEQGVTDVRLGVDWARLQPRPGGLDGRWVEWYHDVVRSAAGRGLRVWLTLYERTVPAWFDDEGGFTDAAAAGRWWPRFVEAVADALGDEVGGWFPLDDPIGAAARAVPDDAKRHGECVETLVVAYRDAWRILHGGPPVATALRVGIVRPADASVPAAEAARREDHLRWRTFLHGLRDGVVRIPGRAERELADLQGACDLIGIELRADLGDDRRVDDAALARWRDRAGTVLRRTAEEGPERPVAVASFRTVWPDPDERGRVASALVEAVGAARADGIEVAGAFYDPGIAAGDGPGGRPGDGLLTRDREPTTVSEVWAPGLGTG
jgi:hypothetical protein